MKTLASPHANTWHHRGGPITQKVDHFGPNPNRFWSVKHTWKAVIGCIEQ